MSIKAKLYKATAALTALCLISSCSTKPNGPEVYLDDKNEEIVITLFAQGETISSLIQHASTKSSTPNRQKHLFFTATAPIFTPMRACPTASFC